MDCLQKHKTWLPLTATVSFFRKKVSNRSVLAIISLNVWYVFQTPAFKNIRQPVLLLDIHVVFIVAAKVIWRNHHRELCHNHRLNIVIYYNPHIMMIHPPIKNYAMLIPSMQRTETFSFLHW